MLITVESDREKILNPMSDDLSLHQRRSFSCGIKLTKVKEKENQRTFFGDEKCLKIENFFKTHPNETNDDSKWHQNEIPYEKPNEP